MTNDINELKSLKKNNDYNIYFYNDFELLRKLNDDNYYLFSVENSIMKLAAKRCSTFKTPTNDYYHYYFDFVILEI